MGGRYLYADGADLGLDKAIRCAADDVLGSGVFQLSRLVRFQGHGLQGLFHVHAQAGQIVPKLGVGRPDLADVVLAIGAAAHVPAAYPAVKCTRLFQVQMTAS